MCTENEVVRAVPWPFDEQLKMKSSSALLSGPWNCSLFTFEPEKNDCNRNQTSKGAASLERWLIQIMSI